LDLARVLHRDVGVERLLALLTPFVLGHDLGCINCEMESPTPDGLTMACGPAGCSLEHLP
jgi:hypothetical protein